MCGKMLACAASILLLMEGMLAARHGEGAYRSGDADRGRREIEAFNKKFIEAHLQMDNAAVLNLWAEDGVSLLPASQPLAGKAAIGRFLDDVVARMPGYRMERVEVDFRGLEVNGDWASEWALEHQAVRPPDNKPMLDSYGKLLLVLHRGGDGGWRIKREMWNQGEKP